MCGSYSVSRRSRRWPLLIFFQLLNIAGINSQILYNSINFENTQKYKRYYLKALAIFMMTPYLSVRAKIKILRTDIQMFLLKYRKTKLRLWWRATSENKRKNRVTTITCTICSKSICKEHAIIKISCPECSIPQNVYKDSDWWLKQNFYCF